MPDAPTFGLFVAAALALLLVPGPSVLYVVGRGVEGGPGVRPGHRVGYPRARGVRRGGTLCDRGLFGDRLLDREVAGCSVPGLARPQAAARPQRRRPHR